MRMTTPEAGPRASWGRAAQELGRAFDPAGKVGELPDSVLVARFGATGDEAAFAALVARHGPMVLAAARAVVRSSSDAEDVFQATFLVLARRSGAIRSGESVGGWLYRIAHRAASRAIAARSRRERPVGDWINAPAAPADRPELAESVRLVHEELARLPDRLRAAVIACDLDGLTRDEAAARLGWPAGTVASRLGRGRTLLRDRLARRGVGADTVLITLARLDPVPLAWAATAGHAGAVAAGTTLAGAVVRGMTWAALTRWGLGTTLVAALVIGPALGRRSTPPEAPIPAPGPARASLLLPVAVPATTDLTEPFAFRGQVVDPDGAPVMGAKVYLIDRGRQPAVVATPSAVADARGRFAFSTEVLRPEPGPNGGPPTAHAERIRLLATAPGFGVGFVRPPWAGPVEVALTRDSGPVRVRVVDSRNRPVAGARFAGIALLVPPIAAGGNGGVAGWLRQAETAQDLNAAQKILASGLDHALDGPDLAVAVELPAATDADGRIAVAGLGQDRALSALVSGPGIATQAVVLTTERLNGPPLVVNAGQRRAEPGRSGFEYRVAVLGIDSTLVGRPGVAVAGTVRDAETAAPLPGVVVRLDDAVSPVKWEYLMDATSDAAGRYRIDGVRGNSRAQFSTHTPAGSLGLAITRLVDVEVGPDDGPVALDLPIQQGLRSSAASRRPPARPAPGLRFARISTRVTRLSVGSGRG